ncbi:MAG: response regulator transcription factor [Alistipes sp.]|nr:response regulator transcription factor [Alistipes sp.]
MSRSYKIVIVERSAIIAEGLKSILSHGHDYEVVCVVDSLRALTERAFMLDMDVVVVGAQSYVEGTALRSLHEKMSGVALVLLASVVREEDVMRQFDSVINIYDNPQQVVKKLNSAIEQSQTNPYSDSHELSEREREVLILVAQGMANKEIADRLNISVHTVMSHRKNITHKTGVKSVAGLTVYALLNNLLDQNDVVL